MALAQTHVGPQTPMGASLLPDGATFRFWAPRALSVYVVVDPRDPYQPDPADEMVRDAVTGHWTGFVPGVADGTPYLFWVVGTGGAGYKRDPWARELGGTWPEYVCVVRDLTDYPWHDSGFVTPELSELTVYELHVGVFSALDGQGRDIRAHRVSKLLDVLDRVEHLADLGVRAVQPLPVVEFRTPSSQGYNGTDIFSPETDYCVADDELPHYLDRVNRRLLTKGCPPLRFAQLAGHVNQLKAFVDILHLYGIAVVLDVVHNHAGSGSDLDDASLSYVDRPKDPGADDNAYFQAAQHAGGPVFRFTDPEVESFLVQNAVMWLTDYHADGLRFDQVGVITTHDGTRLCQDLTGTLHWVKDKALLLAEYWEEDRAKAVRAPWDGLGFDAEYADRLRDAVRDAVGGAATGTGAYVDLGSVGAALQKPQGVPAAWQSYNYLENHDLQLDAPDGGHRKPRVADVAGGLASGWYAHSRSRVAMGLLLTAPGIPALFMGQELLEDKLWSDSPDRPELFLWWGALGDRVRLDFLECTRGLLRLRNRLPGLRSEGLNVFHVNSFERVLAFHRWVPGQGDDVVVVASLRETPFELGSYRLGFPGPGQWTEVFNTDVYPGFPGPWVQGNAGSVVADGPPLHGLPASAGITVPANGLLVFTR